MRCRVRWLIVAVLLVGLTTIAAPIVRAQGPTAVLIFFSPSCGHCAEFREKVWPDIARTYGDAIVATFIDIGTSEGLERLEAEEERIGTRAPDVPSLIIGDELLFAFTPEELGQQVRDAIARHLRLDSEERPPAPLADAPASPTSPAPTADAEAPPIHVAYVEKEGCSECQRAAIVLDVMQNEYPQLVVTTFNSVQDADLVEVIGVHLGLPEEQRLIAPSVYVGDDVLLGNQIVSSDLRALLEKYSSDGAPAFWEELSVSSGAESILSRFERMGPLAVVVAALIDGVNPCAFATILFFVSYLAVGKRPRKQMLIIGLAFTVGVFVTYLLVGLGAMKLLELASAIQVVKPILYGIMAMACFALAGLSVYDHILARRGQAKEMQLNLPSKLRERIRVRIRRTRGAFAGTAFVTGLLVSLLELACTGQVYLPTISFVVGIPNMRLWATLYLVLYNVAFVVPLIIVLLLAVYGVSARRVQQWFTGNLATGKLLMAILFVVLGSLLLTQVF